MQPLCGAVAANDNSAVPCAGLTDEDFEKEIFGEDYAEYQYQQGLVARGSERDTAPADQQAAPALSERTQNSTLPATPQEHSPAQEQCVGPQLTVAQLQQQLREAKAAERVRKEADKAAREAERAARQQAKAPKRPAQAGDPRPAKSLHLGTEEAIELQTPQKASEPPKPACLTPAKAPQERGSQLAIQKQANANLLQEQEVLKDEIKGLKFRNAALEGQLAAEKQRTTPVVDIRAAAPPTAQLQRLEKEIQRLQTEGHKDKAEINSLQKQLLDFYSRSAPPVLTPYPSHPTPYFQPAFQTFPSRRQHNQQGAQRRFAEKAQKQAGAGAVGTGAGTGTTEFVDLE